MPATDPRDTPALIAHILDRFHEGHRRDLPPLVARAQAVSPALGDHLATMAAALELHMFKEEARLFPMMEQGGHSLIGLLIDDLEAEHRTHEAALARLRSLVTAPLPDDLRLGLARFVDELEAHVTIEEEVLFARFPRQPGARPPM